MRSSGGGSRASCSLGACEFVKGPGLYPCNAPRDSQGGTMVHYDVRLPPSQVGMNGAGWYAQGATAAGGQASRVPGDCLVSRPLPSVAVQTHGA